MKELKLYKHVEDDDCYLLAYNNYGSITGILLNDSKYNQKGEFSREWVEFRFEECSDISSGNISISSSNVSDVYLDKDNNNPVMKCKTITNGYIHILINSMTEYKGALEDLKKVDKVIIKVH